MSQMEPEQEYIHELEQLVLNLATFVSGYADLDAEKALERDALLHRVTHLLLHKKPFQEPLEGISGI